VQGHARQLLALARKRCSSKLEINLGLGNCFVLKLASTWPMAKLTPLGQH